MLGASDIGLAVYEIFKNKDQYSSKTISLIGDELTGEEIADTYSKVTNSKAKYEPMTLKRI